ncbi:unnamed protein product [Penicillium salamii]|uniref:Zn(2)-C6 fungal-type domain-containing protein n=1 Tax=Penicillium salamii TaxID=1612424 RepID=A0A9W4P090_9EURO|nr:unnamed protein product [Penicillium salamii]CAG7951119.1 unnamed protein product [Penicillium salamii]CAG8006053.1 unnamed protein product [Penicillium salamii]CAG8049409.1 unnamed protein product [Penicillium salamii]CAG8243353.1 unnamed protein product [Penicillium salamii]
MFALTPCRRIAIWQSKCTKRRIKCDRSIPSCRKCTIRGFQCPGYNRIQLKWTHGRSSRGSKSKAPRNHDQPLLAASKHERDSSITESRLEDDCQLTGRSQPDSISSIEDPATDHCLVDGYTWTTLSDTLLIHFSCHVAPRLTWVDRPDHPWRTVISPLASQNNCLRLSVLSLAAAHLAVTSPTGSASDNVQVLSRRLRDSSVHILNRKIGLELAGYSSATENPLHNLIEIMATALVLCYGEMMIPNSTDWGIHLYACRTLIRRSIWSTQPEKHSPRKHSDAIDFVVKEVADIEVFRNMGAFASDQIFIANTLHPETTLDGYFKTFMGVFREITSEERRRQHLRRIGQRVPTIDMAIWLTKASDAYTRAYSDTAWLSTIHEDDSRRYMEATIRAVYHAVCIYSHQALASDFGNGAQIERSVSLLELEIEFLTTGSAHMFSHDIFVPLFILGTECWGNQTKQDQIEWQFRKLLSSTGIWCNSTALQFLRGFWATSGLQYVNWIQYARENEQHNGPFLVF